MFDGMDKYIIRADANILAKIGLSIEVAGPRLKQPWLCTPLNGDLRVSRLHLEKNISWTESTPETHTHTHITSELTSESMPFSTIFGYLS